MTLHSGTGQLLAPVSYSDTPSVITQNDTCSLVQSWDITQTLVSHLSKGVVASLVGCCFFLVTVHSTDVTEVWKR